jgi:diguanylate cyclase (GGDEF)-like protein
LISHLRYRAWILQLSDKADGVLSSEELAWLVLDHFRKQPGVLLGLSLPSPGKAAAMRHMLSPHLRRGDRRWNLGNHTLWLALEAEKTHLPAVARRLRSLLQSDPVFANGEFCLASAPADLITARELFRDPETGALALSEWRIPEMDLPLAEEADINPSPLADPLTGALVATHAPRALRASLALRKQKNLPLSVIRLDVDRMAEYRRGLQGEELGDKVLKMVAEVLMAHCRETDPVARLEQEEFIIWMAAPLEEAEQAAARLCAAVRESVVDVEGETFRFTLSAGLAAFPQHGQTPGALVECSRHALEDARKRGRGNVAVFQPPVEAVSEVTRVRSDQADRF